MKKIIQFSSVLLVAMLLFSWQPVSAQCPGESYLGVVPEFISGNPSFGDNDADYSCGPYKKFDPPTPGTYAVPGGTITFTIYNEGTCGQYLSWSTTGVIIKKILIKGGPNANLYDYEAVGLYPTSDDNLSAPFRNRNAVYGISHIEFCFEEVFELDIEKTADTKYIREFDWDIEKTPNANINLFTGDTYTHQYTIELTKTLKEEYGFTVFGDITITNNTPYEATISDLTDNLNIGGTIILVTVVCPVPWPYTLAPAGSLTCTYEIELDVPYPDVDNTTAGVNKAVVTTTGKVLGSSATADFDFALTDPDNITLVYDEVNITDTYGGPFGPFSDDATFSYTKKFDCETEGGVITNEGTEFVNRATIDETGDFDEATVTINCFDIEVTKTAVPSFDRTYIWDIQKTEDQVDCVELEFGQLATINYEVSVWMDYYIDSNWKVNGGIAVNNPAPIDAVINSVSDVISPAINATVVCGVTFPYTLVAGGTLNCTYSAALPDATTRTNTATAVLQNYDYFWHNLDGVASAETQSYSGTAEINFTDVIPNKIDECVDVSDTYAGYLGEVCVEDSPKTFTYTRDIGIFEGEYDCDFYYQVDNTASFVTNDTETTGSDDAQVCFYIPCTPPGCETAYAKAENGICFIDGGFASNWGWTNPITPGNYTWPLWAAAGQCITANGTQVGNVHVAYVLRGAKYHVSVEFVLFPGYTLEESHVYAGYAQYPGSDIGNWENEGPFNGTQVYVIAHAVVCGQFTNGAVETYNNNAGNLPEEAGFTEIESFDTFQVRSYPNPFSSAVTFNFTLPEESQVELVIYNLSGQVVARVVDGLHSAGNHNVTWTAPANLLNGLYIYRLQTPEHISIQKMLFSR